MERSSIVSCFKAIELDSMIDTAYDGIGLAPLLRLFNGGDNHGTGAIGHGAAVGAAQRRQVGLLGQ